MIVSVEIPKEVKVNISGGIAKVSGKNGEVSFEYKPMVKFVVENDAVKLEGPDMFVGTYNAHLKNALKGVTEGHFKKMKVIQAHFPMKIEQKGDKIIVKNFVGSKVDRVARVIGNTKVKIKGQDIEVEGPDLYAVGQTAANLRQATKIRNKDVRVFQDGIYPVK
ncbi:MAG: 50S ribosomal protein L6 [Bacteroidales bacterium]|jgi:large subunit ribosomal protein L6|nr:50S ribosomal protein L6 [Bacteroidales bacterium]